MKSLVNGGLLVSVEDALPRPRPFHLPLQSNPLLTRPSRYLPLLPSPRSGAAFACMCDGDGGPGLTSEP